MKTKVIEFLEAVRTSFWFIPALMTLAAGTLAFTCIHLDYVLKDKVAERLGVLYGGGPEGARAVLAAIAGSMITVAGVVFSVTIVMLSLASQQFGPRILRTFIRDRSNQIVLGIFVSTFVYCLLVLRTVRGTDRAEFVPSISVTGGILLAVLSIAILIFFVHHAAGSIQASSVIAAVGRELDAAIDRLYPDEIGKDHAQSEEQPPDKLDGLSIRSGVTGYVQFVDGNELLKLASECDLVIAVAANPGAFVRAQDDLARVRPEARADREVCRTIERAFSVGENRTSAQDIEFLFRQITEIAVRALSPAINDPFTATEALDRLNAALSRLAGRAIPSDLRRDAHGEVRVIASATAFARVARLSLGSICRYGESHEEVISRVLTTVREIACQAHRAADRAVLMEQAHRALDASTRWNDAWSRRRISQEFQELARSLSSVEP